MAAKKGTRRTSTRKTARTGKKSATPRVRPARKAAAVRASAELRAHEEATRGHSEFEMRDDVVETSLQTGEYDGLLQDYFGPGEYEELRQLARDAAARSTRGGPRVLILPGIMGSKIGIPNRLGFFDDVYWIDPIDIVAGRLRDLALPSKKKFQAVGVVLLAYLKLKLRLKRAGYDADFHPFDWRQDIAELGRQLADRIGRERQEVSLVAHSMGGLVARWALGAGKAKVRHLIQLGTPNFGSFAPVMAVRATYPVVRKVGFLDSKHSPESLARDVFSTLPGLIQMLPAPERFDAVDLYDLNVWPADDLHPRKEVLHGVAAMRKGLAPGGDRITLIAGVDRKTVVSLRQAPASKEGFDYGFSLDGDGTVPLAFAELPGTKTYYVGEGHGGLCNHKVVAEAVIDLLDRGETTKLPAERAAARAGAVEFVAEETLRTDPYDARRGGVLSQQELRTLIDDVAAPTAADTQPQAATESVGGRPVVIPVQAGYAHPFDRVVVGRRRQHRIDLRFAFGSITESTARAIALGIFRDVAPAGAAAALDARLGGAISELSQRRMFSGNIGEIFMLPVGRHPLASEHVAFVGLGPFDRFTDEVLQIAAENMIRTFIRARVEEFATVVFGGGSGGSPAEGLRNMLDGFLRGLRDADADHFFRRVVICETQRDRYTALKEELYRLSSTDLCRDVEITFDEEKLPAPPEAAADGRRGPRPKAPVYLIIRREVAGRNAADIEVRSAILTAGEKATVVTGVARVGARDLATLRKTAADPELLDFSGVGRQLSELLISDPVRQVLPRFREHHLVVVHDASMSEVPWETVAFDAAPEAWFPAAEAGLTHRYAADNMSVAKWLEQRLEDGVLRVLLIENPTRDLAGAAREAQRVRKLFADQPGCRVDTIAGNQATRPALLAAFGSGRYDVIHYAGHAFFDARSPAQSGILCHNHVPLTGADLAGIGSLPTLVFFNACESGRVRGVEKSATRLKQHTESVGLAEAFLRGGVANIIGTYWPVGDDAAETFAGTFYGQLLRGEPLRVATQEGRAAIRKLGSKDWANYIFYGDPEFVLKEGLAGLRAAAESASPAAAG
jgi:pimeloyl-ACP methyl ester carboxylesterase